MYVDNRIWCHPKLLSCSLRARWTYVAALAYSSGFGTLGTLTKEQQKAIGSTSKTRTELISKQLWHASESDAETVLIHDWKEHNGQRDDALEARKQADRERKRRERASQQSRDTSQDSHVTMSAPVTGQSLARDRTRARPVTYDLKTHQQQQPVLDHPTAAADDDELQPLRAAGWTTNQLNQITDPERALAWLEHAEQDPNVRAPGALAWTGYNSNGWPSPPRTEQTPLIRYHDPNKRCPDCDQTHGHGHLETCPRMPTTTDTT